MTRADLATFVAATPSEELPTLIGDLEAAKAAAWARMIRPAPVTTTAMTPDRNISVEDAARSLGVSPSWLYKNHRELPFVGHIGRRVVCSAAGVERYRRRRLNGSP